MSGSDYVQGDFVREILSERIMSGSDYVQWEFCPGNFVGEGLRPGVIMSRGDFVLEILSEGNYVQE